MGTKRFSADTLRIVQGAMNTRAAAKKTAAGRREERQPLGSLRAAITNETSTATPRYSGRTSASAPNNAPGSNQRHHAPSQAQSATSTPPDKSVAASGSLISIPWYSSNAG